MTYRSIRVSDEDRESVAGLLGDAYVAGRLDRAEFDERCAAAYVAKTWGQLSDLTADLPCPPLRAADLPAGGAVPAGTTWGRRKGAGRPRVALLDIRRGDVLVSMLVDEGGGAAHRGRGRIMPVGDCGIGQGIVGEGRQGGRGQQCGGIAGDQGLGSSLRVGQHRSDIASGGVPAGCGGR